MRSLRIPAAFLLLSAFVIGCTDQPVPTGLSDSPAAAAAPGGAPTALLSHASGFSYAFVEFGDLDPPSAVAKNGDQLDISLSEDLAPFTFHPKTVSGGGSFTIRNAAGEVLSTGTWVATKLNSFQSYGSTEVEPGVFLFGGTLHLHIALSTGEKAILRLRCTDFGNPPPGAMQGMALQVVGGNHFTGDWVFVGDDPVGSTQGATFFVEN